MKTIDGKLYGYEYELKADSSVDDLTEFRAVDSGSLFIALNGLWYEQPVKWYELDARASQLSTVLPSVTSDDNGDVLTVVEGAWANAAPSGGSGSGATVVELLDYFAPDSPPDGDQKKDDTKDGVTYYEAQMSAADLWEAANSGPVIFTYTAYNGDMPMRDAPTDGSFAATLSGAFIDDGAYVFVAPDPVNNITLYLGASDAADYPNNYMDQTSAKS